MWVVCRVVHEPLNVRILPRAVNGRRDFLDTAALEELRHAVAVDGVVVPMHEPRLLAEWHRVAELLDHPGVTVKKSIAHATSR